MEQVREPFVEPEIVKHEEKMADVTATYTVGSHVDDLYLPRASFSTMTLLRRPVMFRSEVHGWRPRQARTTRRVRVRSIRSGRTMS
jgi:hypothetical protein